MKKEAKPVLAWHYTLGANLLRILEGGYILPQDDEDTPVIECPVAWFSLNERFEPSALKRVKVNGMAQAATLEAMHQHGNGVYRLGLPPKQLLAGEALRKHARISKERWQQLAQVAEKCGADMSEWFGSIDPVSASDCYIERHQPDGTWLRVAGPQTH